MAIQPSADKSSSKQSIIITKFNRKIKTQHIGSLFNEHLSATAECKGTD